MTSNIVQSKGQQQVGLITFDLDDTLFPVGKVVQDANNAMFHKLAELGFDDATEEGYIVACKDLRKELYQPGCSNPITYSELRKRGIRREMENCRLKRISKADETSKKKEKQKQKQEKDDDDDDDDDVIVEKVFDAWLEERHASAERNLFEDTIEMFETLREKYPNTCIAAVTNGRGSPMDMPKTIKKYFDFCVSGEDDDVFPFRKPHEGIFKVTLSKAAADAASKTNENVFSEKGEMLPSHCWIHVGDDLANDVGASAACGAKAVWVSLKENLNDKKTFVTTASKEEQEARAKMNEKALSFVSYKIEALSELPEAIQSIV